MKIDTHFFPIKETEKRFQIKETGYSRDKYFVINHGIQKGTFT